LYTKLNDRKKITTQIFFSCIANKKKFYIFITTQAFVYKVYILFENCIYIRIFCIEKQRIEKHVFVSIRSEVSSLLSVFSRLFYVDAHVGAQLKSAKCVAEHQKLCEGVVTAFGQEKQYHTLYSSSNFEK
jgi:hypothetical protein